ncbi:MAG: TonB-dependent receptor [Flavobacterium nitrogenifigens]|uniref:TonB-linked outer membrane protein, SusC/RagA family n=1 Tax=Flavobacterium nitrogenifigens TaxID=1617283 RepID=A0A521C7X6_9FLAO|nr:TonB-dependent receptor [Flavobacterium nitrogenifigens]KAF2326966.1 TonB-dependent receptor [Flavobacterium nitrogenifigens]MDQ8013410.1 TonB-dependent receptor [Flavobacterium nitrogenifigens]SMO55475.1 TonB-linked outer membrane protein, SusC/RagA family [Flavobacterium nitrogenifigens]
MKLTKLLVFCISSLLFSVIAVAQDVTVNGIINDENGLPVPGATVLLKGTTKSTASDFDGKFQMQVPSNGTLTITFIGYSTVTEAVNGRTKISIQLKPESQSLNEVVVVGYGTQKKSVVTGAISSVKASDLEDLPITRVEQSLQGRVSGVTIAANAGQPGSASTIRVRGITSFGNNEPLWVVDGVIVDSGGIGYLNQSDIASMEVLKDAASQAIYGARAAAGVILITTKKGKSGKMSVNYNGYTGFSAAARKLDLLNATEYATIMNERYANGYTDTSKPYDLPYKNVSSYGAGTDWQKTIFNDNAQRTGHELSLSGGNDVSTFYVSFGLLDQEGIVATPISNYNRKNIRLNSTHKIVKGLTFGQTLGYSHEKTVGIGNTNNEYGGPLSSAINLDPITPAVVTDPTVANNPPYSNQAGILRDANGNPYGISQVVTQEMSNPLAYIQTRLGNYNWADNFVGNAYLELEAIKGLKIRSTLGGKLAYWGSESFTPVFYFNSSTINSKNNLSRSSNRGFGWNIENTISYAKQIEDHNFSVLVGQGAYVDNITSGSTVTYFNIPYTNFDDATFPNDHPQDNITASAYNGYEHKVTSLFARANYDYKEKYLFTGIVRRDGSSRFGQNYKYGTFPSFSLGWVPTKESFWPENKVVTQLKFRGGYGITGSDAIGDFKYLATIGSGRNYTIGDQGSVVVGNSPNAPANPDLKWEETSQANVAFDITFFNDLSLTTDFYVKKSKGILQDIDLPGHVGSTGRPSANIADMENKGIDLELSYRKKIGKVGFSISGNISYLENEVTNLGKDIQFISGDATFQNMGAVTRTQVGQTYNSFYGYKTQGIFQNQAEINAYTNASGGLIQPGARPGDFRWQDLNGDGKISDDDKTFIGSPLPKYTYGFTINLDYKNFDLLIFTQGAIGNKIFQGLRRLDITDANYQTSALGRWTGEGSTNSYPILSTVDNNKNFSNPSDFYLEDGDYWRIKTVQIGYNLPNDVVSKAGLSKTRLYLTGENLLTFTKYSGYDPEIGGGVFGIDKGYYPQARTIMVGVNLQF